MCFLVQLLKTKKIRENSIRRIVVWFDELITRKILIFFRSPVITRKLEWIGTMWDTMGAFGNISSFFSFKYKKLNDKTCRTGHLNHGLRTANEAFFHWNPEILGLGRQIEQINYRAFGVFSAELSAPILVHTVSPFSMFSIIQPLFLQKTKLLYPHPKYSFGIGIWIWFSLHVSVVRDLN